jgi:hypothetical protein
MVLAEDVRKRNQKRYPGYQRFIMPKIIPANLSLLMLLQKSSFSLIFLFYHRSAIKIEQKVNSNVLGEELKLNFKKLIYGLR